MIDIKQLIKGSVFVSPVQETVYTVTYADAINIVWIGRLHPDQPRRVSRISREGALNFLNTHKYTTVPK